MVGLLTWVRWDEFARLQWPGDVEVVPYFVDSLVSTSDCHLGTMGLGEGIDNLIASVGLRVGGGNAGFGECLQSGVFSFVLLQ